MNRAMTKTKGAKAKADRLFSLIVRSRGACEKCGGTNLLQTAHIISRRYSATRTDVANAFCLCFGCHMYFTDHPVAFADFVRERIGQAEYDRLFALSETPTKVDWVAEAARLQAIWTQLEKRSA